MQRKNGYCKPLTDEALEGLAYQYQLEKEKWGEEDFPYTFEQYVRSRGYAV